MKYFVSRDGKEYGPYSLVEIRTYLAQNRMLATDPVRAENGQRWGSIADLLATMDPSGPPLPPRTTSSPNVQRPVAAASSPYAPPATSWQNLEQAAPLARGEYPFPPGQTWVALLLLSWVTCGIYYLVAMFRQAAFAKEIDPGNESTKFYIGYVVLVFCYWGAAIATGGDGEVSPIATLLVMGSWVCMLVGAFKLRRSLLDRFGVATSGVMTFFFSALYFQYHLHNLHEAKMGRR